ncbi:alpha/beta fold hydrolase [Nocardiopsis flavescens]|uniref:Proline iminopeptidase n=1 Tax=Nocardiopsis flavescens TaxID=758803 RepID=A0A1M6B390_9ACTN|nr:alpha/beta hydrolase [Nocardiopsis flavescens]SHI43204.1 proline iminopeptidase [Nocardiopsis flavescens]
MTLPRTHGLTPVGDGARLHWTALGHARGRPPVVLLHGGPGLPDYLGDLAPMVADLTRVHRYDQRGTGRSPWRGRHTLARHADDLAALLDAWDAPSAVLVGHSYGADLAARFCLRHPGRAAAVQFVCGPFTGDWRAGYRAERARRMSPRERERLVALEGMHRTGEQEVELLTLAWSTDHADPERGRSRAARAARLRRPVNWAMNAELGEQARRDPLDARLDELGRCLPARAAILAGARDPRPVSALEALARRLSLPLVQVGDAGHEPWLERPEAVRAHLRGFVRDAVTA